MINKIINRYRRKIAKNTLINNLCNSLFWLIILIFIFSFIESIFYLDTNMRYKIFSIVSSFAIALLLYTIFKFLIIHYGLLENYNDITVSKIIGEKHQSIKDGLTNIIQIQKLQDAKKKLNKISKK